MKAKTYADELQRFDDMLAFIRDALEMIEGLDFEAWVEGGATRYGTERAVELLGEAARAVPDGLKAEFAALPWKQMIAMRNILARDYGEINFEVVFQTVRDIFPGLLPDVQAARDAVQGHGDAPLP
ncbi:DUF86 domain-containing protein [Candidatus Poribacteria bacterium]|nr:DUF86 domain-containing protein [Candidatus Poribacteria bacterium]